MSNRQRSIWLDDTTVKRVDKVGEQIDAGNRSEAVSQLLDEGIERHKQRQRMPDSAVVVRHGILTSLLAFVVALAVGTGLGSEEVMWLAGTFGGTAVLLSLVMGAMVVHARRGLL